MNTKLKTRCGIVALCVLTTGWLVLAANAEDKQKKKTQAKPPVVSPSVPKSVAPEAKPSLKMAQQTFFPEPTPFELKFQSKLSETMEIEFVDAPLEDVIDYFQEFSGVSFVALKNQLEEEGITLDDSVNIEIPEISFKSALSLVLKPLGLTYVVEQDFVMITTEYAADEILKTRVYPVGDYCQSPEDYDALVQAIKNASLGKWKTPVNLFGNKSNTTGSGQGFFQVTKQKVVGGGLGGGLGSGFGGGGFSGSFGQKRYEPGIGGTISVVLPSKSLVISQTAQAHEAITELLNLLRQARTAD